jgi:hypothetical protein
LVGEPCQFSSKQRTWAVGGWQFGFAHLPVRAHKFGNRTLNIGHPCSATPAGRQVRLNLSCAPACKFAISGLKQLLVRDVCLFSQHTVTARPRG